MEEYDVDEKLSEKFDFYSSCLLVAFVPFVFAPVLNRAIISPDSYELVRLFIP